MALQAKYPFLETLNESEAMARGANLDDKINYTVYNTIKGLSTQDSVRAATQFTLDTFVPDILNMTKSALAAVVRKLVVDHLVVQIFRLQFDAGRRQMQMVPCFLAQPTGDRDTIFSLWVETNSLSIGEVEKMLESRPALDQKLFVADLALDLKSEQLPKTEEFKYAVVDFFSGVHAGNFEIVPPAQLIPATLAELQDELSRRQIALDIPDYGYLPLGSAKRVDLFELAGRFLTTRVIPRYKNRGNLKGELERILLEEARYHEGDPAPGTTEFTLSRATAVRKEALAAPRGDQGARFPGTLTVEIISRLAPLAAAEYEEGWREKNEGFVRDFVDGINGGDTWLQVIRFMSEKDLEEAPPLARERLLSGGDLFTDTWLREDGEVRVFVRREISTFRMLVEGMQSLPAFQHWQILSLRSLMEKNEYELRGLFDDPEFVRAYGRLLRLVYQDYFPWYLRLLLALGLSMFQDSAFKIAKQKIQNEQKFLRDRHARTRAAREKQDEEERKVAALRVRDTTLGNRLIETLDDLYLERNKIPTVEEARLESDMSSSEFDDIIKRGTFQKIKLSDGGMILLYPLDHNWRSRVARLRRVLDRIRENIDEDVGDSMGERVRKLEKHLTATESARPESPEDDPYGRFGKAVKEHEEKLSEPLDVDFSDDLEV